MLPKGKDYHITDGWDSLLSRVFIGCFRAYMGMHYFGQWFERLAYKGVYLLPAMINFFVLMV